MPGSFAVPTGELFRHAGARHPVTLAGRVPGLALSTTRLADDDVVAELVLEAQGDAVIAVGHRVGPLGGGVPPLPGGRPRAR